MGDVASGNQQLGNRHRVIRKEVNFQVFLGIRIRVDNPSDIDDELDHQFGNIVSRSGLSSKEHDTGVNLLALRSGHGFESEVSLRSHVNTPHEGLKQRILTWITPKMFKV